MAATRLKLSALDQIMPRVYSRLILCLPVANSETAEAAAILRKAFENTSKDVPELKSSVIPSSDSPGKLELQWGSETKFLIKDQKSDAELSYTMLRELGFPLSKLDESLTPVGMLPTSTAPAVAAQVNIVDGGIIFCVAFHHSVMDGTGYSTVFKLLASHCGGASFALSSGSLDRQPLFHLHGTNNLPPAYEIPKNPSHSPEMPSMSTAIFTLDASAISLLKHDIAEEISGHGEGAVWTSTNDVIATVLWHGIVTARSSNQESRLGMAVNGRSRLSLPETYLGNVNIYATCVVPASTLQSTSVEAMAQTAVAVRKSISQVDQTYISNLVKAVESLDDPSKVAPSFKSFLGPDLAITSWLDMGFEDLEWGSLLGKVDAVRIPQAAFDGLCIILPRTVDDGIEVLVGLKTEHMERLKDDEHFAKFASFSSE